MGATGVDAKAGLGFRTPRLIASLACVALCSLAAPAAAPAAPAYITAGDPTLGNTTGPDPTGLVPLWFNTQSNGQFVVEGSLENSSGATAGGCYTGASGFSGFAGFWSVGVRVDRSNPGAPPTVWALRRDPGCPYPVSPLPQASAGTAPNDAVNAVTEAAGPAGDLIEDTAGPVVDTVIGATGPVGGAVGNAQDTAERIRDSLVEGDGGSAADTGPGPAPGPSQPLCFAPGAGDVYFDVNGSTASFSGFARCQASLELSVTALTLTRPDGSTVSATNLGSCTNCSRVTAFGSAADPGPGIYEVMLSWRTTARVGSSTGTRNGTTRRCWFWGGAQEVHQTYPNSLAAHPARCL